jgi:hypothetical protein
MVTPLARTIEKGHDIAAACGQLRRQTKLSARAKFLLFSALPIAKSFQ